MPSVTTGIQRDDMRADIVLTQLSREYAQSPRNLHLIAPPVPVVSDRGELPQYGKEGFVRYDGKRPERGTSRRITRQYTGEQFVIDQYSLESPLDDHEARKEAELGIDSEDDRIGLLTSAAMLDIDGGIADIIQNSANYADSNKTTLTGTDKWSDPTNSNPGQVIDDARQAVRSKTGRPPNVLTLGSLVFDALSNHEDIKAKFNNSGSFEHLMPEQLAMWKRFDLVIVVETVEANPVTGELVDLFGNNAVLSYVDPRILAMNGISYSPDRNQENGLDLSPKMAASWMTFVREGTPFIAAPYRQEEIQSTIYRIHYDHGTFNTFQDGAFLIQDCV
jgi:hypothetical protein